MTPMTSLTPTAQTQIPVDPRSLIGTPVRRTDAMAKTTGAARYTAEDTPQGTVYAALLQSTVAAGRITAVDRSQAERMPGVLQILTHENAPRLAPVPAFPEGTAAQDLVPLQDDRIRFAGQPVGLVVADTPERAADAAARVRITYDSEPIVPDADADTDTDADAAPVHPVRLDLPDPDTGWGDADHALADSAVVVEARYTTPREYHAALEPHATLAEWTGDGCLTVREASQWVLGARQTLATWFGIPSERVHIVSPYVGGAFGSRALVHPHTALAALAARELERPVKLVLTRGQVFGAVTPRAATRQRVVLGADTDGRLQGLIHEGSNETAAGQRPYLEPLESLSRYVYDVPNLRTAHRLLPVHMPRPGWMRAPGEAMGSFALESALDELAAELGMDPVELRLRNYAARDRASGKPWSTCALREAYAEGSTAFGWEDRSPAPRTMQEDGRLVGWGMATTSCPRYLMPAEAAVRVRDDGTAEVACAATDLGTGLRTVVIQAAADALGLPPRQVTAQLGDSRFPRAPFTSCSQLASSLLPVVIAAAAAARDDLVNCAVDDPSSPLYGAPPGEVTAGQGKLALAHDPRAFDDYATVLRRCGRKSVECVRDSMPEGATRQDRHRAFTTQERMLLPTAGAFSVHSWGAHFVEVRVDEELGGVQVTRMVGAFDCGRVLNPETARSQLTGGMVMSLGAALLEAAVPDRRDARIVGADLAEYLIPASADIPDIQVLFVGEPDPEASALGSKPVGELGVPGVAAAVANAVYHATGRRIRDLPIRREHLL